MMEDDTKHPYLSSKPVGIFRTNWSIHPRYEGEAAVWPEKQLTACSNTWNSSCSILFQQLAFAEHMKIVLDWIWDY